MAAAQSSLNTFAAARFTLNAMAAAAHRRLAAAGSYPTTQSTLECPESGPGPEVEEVMVYAISDNFCT